METSEGNEVAVRIARYDVDHGKETRNRITRIKNQNLKLSLKLQVLLLMGGEILLSTKYSGRLLALKTPAFLIGKDLQSSSTRPSLVILT